MQSTSMTCHTFGRTVSSQSATSIDQARQRILVSNTQLHDAHEDRNVDFEFSRSGLERAVRADI